jgi:cell division protein FtsN
VQSASAGREPANAAAPPVFTYPQILAKQEVVVPDGETPRPAPPSKTSSAGDTRDAGAAASTDDGSLVLQVAALRTAAEADALRAKLAALGLQAEVQVAKINNETFHRVRLGPYSSQKNLSEAQGRLKAAGYASVVLRKKPQ